MKRDAVPANCRMQVDWLGGPPEPREWKPMYRFAVEDDLAIDCEENVAGLHGVLTWEWLFFAQKRLCVVATEGGHITLCNNRVKFVHKDAETREEPLETEDKWRNALKTYFNIELQPEGATAVKDSESMARLEANAGAEALMGA